MSLCFLVLFSFQAQHSWQTAEWLDRAESHYQTLETRAIEDVSQQKLNFKNVNVYWNSIQKQNTLDGYYKYLNAVLELQHRDEVNSYDIWLLNGINAINPILDKDQIPRRIAHSMLWASACADPSSITVKTAYKAWKEFRSPQALWSVATVFITAPTIKDRENAVSILEGLLRQGKSLGRLHNDIGMAYWQLGRLTKRKSDFEKGIKQWEQGIQYVSKNQQAKLKVILERRKEELAKMKF
ncbi:hypothetical protein IQ258_29450 [Coleofasciculus sp. LEGE 07081]|uniref:hypothetical protein n=1 Tax=Coleofasciculus sp. LEGE 07081 TaxID=2777967 RepID=UPI00187E296E|nr:hypothetical protein [Coleofasciculus sp. LEGE 07081]MBE9130146.1 hypothetical protein [Coleofasciculus sp. LEGE 07081]